MTGTSPSWIAHASFPAIRKERLFFDRIVDCFADRPTSLYQIFKHGCDANPEGEAIVAGGQRIHYVELELLVAKVAASLRSNGIICGTRIAILLENCPEYVTLLLAIAKLGAISVPLNIREAAPELAYIINDCGAAVVLCCNSLADKLPASATIPSVKTVLSVDLTSPDSMAPLTAHGLVVESEPVDQEDAAVILYTSGTTGHPKGAILSHVNIVHSVLQYQHAMTIEPSDRSIIAVPMSHVTGLVALILPIIGAGATLIIMHEFKADLFIEIAVAERMTHSLLVPAMFALCLLRPDINEKDLSAWRVSGYGGAIMPEASLVRIAAVAPGLQLINCYGATETTSPAVMMPPHYATERSHQVGLPVPCADIRVMDDGGREVAPDEIGEIWISGPMVVKGYWNNPEANAREFVGGYWRSGDVGRADQDGFIQIVDRIKDVINRGGYKIYASEVENLLLGHAKVTEVAVVSKPCPVLGERVHAFLVTSEEMETGDLQAHCRSQIADYKQPEKYHFVQSLPRNANGKVLKRELRSFLETQ